MAPSNEIVNGILEVIIQRFDPARVYLFGSLGRGDAGQASDIDLLIVEKDGQHSSIGRMDRIADLMAHLPERRVPVDVLVYTAGEFDLWRNCPNHIVGRATTEGRLLYARP